MDNTRFTKVNFSKKIISVWLHQKKESYYECRTSFTKIINKYKKYKNHRNLISTLLKRSKQNYYEKYFEPNLNNSKNTWKGNLQTVRKWPTSYLLLTSVKLVLLSVSQIMFILLKQDISKQLKVLFNLSFSCSACL